MAGNCYNSHNQSGRGNVIDIAALPGPDNGYAIITYPPMNTYGMWITSGNRPRFASISFKAAITDGGEEVMATITYTPVDKLWQGRISYGSHNLGYRVTPVPLFTVSWSRGTNASGHAAQMLPVLLQLRIHSTSCSMNNFLFPMGET